MRFKILFCCLFCVTRWSCVSSSGPMPFGKDSFIITTSAGGSFNNSGAALQGAIKDANAHCASIGEVMIPRNTSTSGVPGFPGGAQFIYSCVNENDLEYQRPQMQKEPDTKVIIENQMK